jgi:hypothetical protein
MPPVDLTLYQVRDLARYFLGRGWCGVNLPGDRCMLVHDDKPMWTGMSWREVFRAAGVQLPLRPQYVAQGLRVMMADKAVCTSTSNTMAKRIAAALNDHIPDRRGI